MAAAIPTEISAYIWIPFTVVILLTLLFSGSYVCYFQSRYDSEFSSTAIAILGLTVVILTSLLLPVDVFLVSFMKTSNGTFQEWASNSTFRQNAENSMLYAYYTMYGIILCFAFFILPFVYFYFEEKDDDRNNIASRLCTAFKYTLVFLLLLTILLLLGLFIPIKEQPPKNSTEWKKLEFLFLQIAENQGQHALSFILNALTLIGMVTLIIYSGIGLSIWPIGMIKGSKNAEKEHEAIREERSATQNEISTLKEKCQRKKLTSREHAVLTELEESQHLIERQERHLQETKLSWLYKCRFLIYPVQIFLGIFGAIFGFFVWLSLLLTNIDKIINSMGYKMGYALSQPSLPNPLDFLLVQSQQVFPIDYIIFTLVTLFLVVITISGIRKLGLWCLCVKMYKIRIRRTPPQGLLMLCMTVMFTILGINVLMFSVSPQYTMYGSQHYVANVTEKNLTSHQVKRCSTEAAADECVMTRASYLLLEFVYNAWFFGAVYYWASWVFLLVAVIGFFVALGQQRQSAIVGAVDRDDFEESDDEMIRV